ncbi:RlpA-like double-psi beta-barrel domain-containing protein [Roseicella aquatilis]|uniref:Endolytic peptidoglycan transglycosylase RlpA n=1 Tax=Roseicella aquatilis TaxID=2527868 RepID=A0A4R4DW75_9PROT|nr:RlpA-like double-psi beta-barrel domain-containing protein [Roseicella aquatilis]TCZ66791.1 sporulation and cell division repeat protein [Roseicella aquatilis]
MRPGLAALALLGLAALGGCQGKPLPPSAARYMVGEPYSLGGVWSYPKEEFGRSETGLAAVLPDRRAGRRTTDGEIFDPVRLMGAHRTLQLPAIATVLNLENGREIRVRLNDRGPAQPGRVVGLSARAGTLLGIPAGGTAQVRVTVEDDPSRALARGLPTEERNLVRVEAAPTAAIERESLAPLPGARQVERPREAPRGVAAASVAGDAAGLPPDPLPEQVVQRPPQPGRLYLETGSFFRRDLAQRQASRIGARVEAFGEARSVQYRVRLGPFPDVAAADRAVAEVLAAGLPEVKLLVE